jgi:hypothetical protein
VVLSHSKSLTRQVAISRALDGLRFSYRVPVRLQVSDGKESRESHGKGGTSEYTLPAGFSGLTIAANEEVMTTLLTAGACFLTACKIPTVPLIAGSSISFFTSVTL